MTPPPRNARLLHSIVVMGVALTGATFGTGCGGSIDEGTRAVDGGGTKDGEAPDGYPIIYPAPPRDAAITTDAYATIGIYEGDAGDATYGTIKSSFDATVDAYPTIEPAVDAGFDGYPVISPPPPGGH